MGVSFFNRSTAAISVALVTLTALSGCDKLTPNGGSSTMTLLRSGSEQICVADDVRKSLHDLIVPKVEDVSGELSTEDKLSAINTVTVSFDLTTLQGFDKAVSKASCNATVKISGQGDKSNKFDIDYVVSPSAENPNSFIITARSTEAKAFATALINDALQEVASAREKQEQDAQEKQARSQLLATISPKWLIGTWIAPDTNAINCSNGHALSFVPNHSLGGGLISGRWTLSADEFHAVGQGLNGPLDMAGTITAADPLSFTLTAADGSTSSLRRCTSEEVHRCCPTRSAQVPLPRTSRIATGSARAASCSFRGCRRRDCQ